MRQYKESEWREEVEDIERANYLPKDLGMMRNGLNISRATTRGAVLHFYFSLPKDYQADRSQVLDVRRRLRAIRRERRKRAITTRIYRWQLQCEYKRITKHDQTK